MGQNCACFFKSYETEGHYNLPEVDNRNQPMMEHQHNTNYINNNNNNGNNNEATQSYLSKSPISGGLSKTLSYMKETTSNNNMSQSKRQSKETSAMIILHKHIKSFLYRKKYLNFIKKELRNYQDELVKGITKHLLNENCIKSDKQYHEMYNQSGWSKYYKDTLSNQFNPNETQFKNSICIEYSSPDTEESIKTITPLINKSVSLFQGSVNIDKKKHGFGELITKESKLKGDWIKDKFTGWNSKITSNGQMLIGKYINEILHGKGECYTLEGYSYKGDYVNNLKEGKGIEVMNNSTYEGEFRNDMKNGIGKIVFASGDVYEGEFVNGIIEGKGHYIWNRSKHEYIGEYKGGKFHGNGYYKINEEEYYKGEYRNGVKEGKGEITFANRMKYIGPFANGKPNGVGIFDNGKNFKGEAEFIDGKLNKKYKKKKD